MRETRWKRVMLFGVVAASLFLLVACEEEDIGIAVTVDSAKVTATGSEMVEMVIEAPLSLFVETSNGDVNIVGKPGIQTASVVATKWSRGATLEEARDRLDRLVVRIEQEGSDLRLVYRASEQESDVRRYSGVDFDVIVPTEARVSVDTSNGTIDVTAIHGTLTLDTSNGAIDVRRCEGTLSADTSNGRIDVVSFAGDIRADTSNGEVRIENVVGLVDAETSNGSIRYEGAPADGMTNRLRTSNGSITVRVPFDASIAFDVRTSGGRIRSDLPLVGDTEGDDWSATLNPPATSRLDLRTSNGSVRIEGAS